MGFQPIDRQRQALAAGGSGGQPKRAAEPLAPLVKGDAVTAQGGDPRRFQSSRSTAHHQHPMGIAGRDQRRELGLALVAGGRMVGATQARILYQADDVILVGEQAGPDVVDPVLAQLGRQFRIGDQRPGHLHRVGFAFDQQRRRHAGIDDAALGEYRQRHRRLDQGGQMDGEAGWLVQARPGEMTGVDAAAGDADEIDPTVIRQMLGDLGGIFRFDPGPGRVLVADQPQANDQIAADLATHCFDHLAGETQPVLQRAAVLVVALVGQRR